MLPFSLSLDYGRGANSLRNLELNRENSPLPGYCRLHQGDDYGSRDLVGQIGYPGKLTQVLEPLQQERMELPLIVEGIELKYLDIIEALQLSGRESPHSLIYLDRQYAGASTGQLTGQGAGARSDFEHM